MSILENSSRGGGGGV